MASNLLFPWVAEAGAWLDVIAHPVVIGMIASVATRAHTRQHRLRQLKRGNHIGVEQMPQLAQLDLLERAGKRVAGAVDQYVDATVVGVDLLDE